MFGHASLLSEWPTALAVRAAEDSLLYRLPAEALRPVLARPAALRFAARSLAGRYEMLHARAGPAGDRRRRPRPPSGQPPAPRRARDRRARRDGAGGGPPHGRGQLVVRPGRSRRRLRHRHRPRPARAGGGGRRAGRHAGLAGDDRSRRAPSPPTSTGADALLDMLDRGVRHLPVVDVLRPRDRRHLRHRSDGGGDAHARSTCGGRSRRRPPSRSWRPPWRRSRTPSSACTTPRSRRPRSAA